MGITAKSFRFPVAAGFRAVAGAAADRCTVAFSLRRLVGYSVAEGQGAVQGV